MGAVYRAVDTDTGALVAVKLVRRQPGATGPARRFRREFSAVARLRHPNIVAVYRYGVCDDGEYIVMEWVPGGDLWQVAGRRARRENEPRALPMQWVAPVISVAAQVCDAMSYLHAHRILHRDLKPENILVDGAGRARLVDFGIAKPLALDPVAPLTAVGETVGTARYMSPEQARSLDLDGRADLYSLGVILFEVISGQPPFTAPSLFDLLMAHVTEPAPLLADLVPQLPRSLCDVVNRLLEKDRSNRYPDAGSLRDELIAHLSPDCTLQAASSRHADPRDLPLAVVGALEAAGRAAEVRAEHAGLQRGAAAQLIPGGRVPTPDLTNAQILVEHRPPPIRPWFDKTPSPDASQTRPFPGADAEAPTPEAAVREGEEARPGELLFPRGQDILELEEVAELFAPAFRGRDHLMAAALEGYRSTSNRPSLQWFRGPSGSGRTRLLAEIRDLLRFELGAMVLTSRGQDPAVGMSTARIWFERMPRLLRHHDAEHLAAALGPSAAMALDLCPGLAEPFQAMGIDPTPPDPGSRRILYYQAAERMIALVAAESPVVLLTDDAERMDPDSLDLLRYLATPRPDDSELRGRPRLIVLVGDGEIAPWAGSGTPIPPLMGPDISVTLQTALGWTVPPSRLARRAVIEHRNATPRTLLDWVRSLLHEAGLASGREATEDDLLAVASGDPRMRWMARMRGLDQVGLEAVGVLGLVNRPVTLDWLIAAGTWPDEDAIIEAVNAVVRRNLATERPSAGGWGLELVDREAGDVAWEMLDDATRRAAASSFAARVTEDHPQHPAAPDERPALAARAYLKAGMPETALPLLAAATRFEQAAGRSATGLAMADLWVETAREIGHAELADALAMRVQLACAACEWGRAEKDLDAMEALAGQDVERLLRVYTARATMCQQSQDHEGVIDAVERAFHAALEVDAPREVLFRLSHLVASVDQRAGALVAARDRWLGIAAEARAIVNPYWEMLGRAAAAAADQHLGEVEAADHGFRKARQLAEDQCDELTILQIDLNLAGLHALRGNAGRALSETEAVAEGAEELGALRVLGQAMTNLGEFCRRLDRLAEAELHLERAERILRNTEQRVTLALCLAERALAALQGGDLEGAQNHAAGAGMAATLCRGVLLEQERVHYAVGRVAEVRGDRMALAAAKAAAIDCLEQQAANLGPEHLGRWISVTSRLDVVSWAGWSPRTRR
jgi:serine/threonine protein kinase/tetratricopeptide (TPR) repeat protein